MSSESSRSNYLTTTLGVEIEFMLVYDQDLEGCSDGGRMAGARVMHNYWKEALPSVPVNAVLGVVTKGGYDKWTITSDGSIRLKEDEREKAGLVSIDDFELRSRVFDYDRDDWAGEITTVLGTLLSRFNRPATDSHSRMIVNSTCGLHVHVGKGTKGKTFSLRAIKNLYQLTTAFERVIDSLHSVSRIEDGSRFCHGPSYDFESLARMMEYRQLLLPRHPLAWCDYIELTGTVEDLCRIYHLQQGHSSAYNFDNMSLESGRFPSEAKTHTVEFRQHRGTLDAREINAWIEVAICMIQWAEDTDEVNVRELLASKVEDPNHNILDLLRSIGAQPGLVDFYGLKLLPDTAHREMVKAIDREPQEKNNNFLALVEAVEKNKFRDREPACVKKEIVRKLKEGAYGLFSSEVVLGIRRVLQDWY